MVRIREKKGRKWLGLGKGRWLRLRRGGGKG